ncbi:hypothetical protein NQ318_018661 [Aromia moschata]|uniref:Uncharacterized protein n=1 Tax=Aromia moschata TaxID=1265417 RepID=A0AAV8ZGU9_9CUCU|nr:hypothetical protein NQ318_018661 [Aromia moschata]
MYEVCKLSNETGSIAPDLATLRRRDLEVVRELKCVSKSTATGRAISILSNVCSKIAWTFNTSVKHPRNVVSKSKNWTTKLDVLRGNSSWLDKQRRPPAPYLLTSTSKSLISEARYGMQPKIDTNRGCLPSICNACLRNVAARYKRGERKV